MSDFGLLGMQSSPKWEIPCLGRQWTAVQTLMPLALFSVEKCVTVHTHTNKQTVIDISTPCLSACVDNESMVVCIGDVVVRVLIVYCSSPRRRHWATIYVTRWLVRWLLALLVELEFLVPVALPVLVAALLSVVMPLVARRSTTFHLCFKTTTNWRRMPNARMSCRFVMHRSVHCVTIAVYSFFSCLLLAVFLMYLG